MVREHKIIIETRTFVRFWLVIAALAAIGVLLYSVRTGLFIIMLAAFLAIAINPIVTWLVRKMPGRGNRTAASALAYIAVLAVFFGAIALVVPMVVREGTKLLQTFPETAETAVERWSSLNTFLEDHGLGAARDQVLASIDATTARITDNLGSNLWTGVKSVMNGLAATLIMLVMTFFMLTEGPRLWNAFWRRYDNSRHTRVRDLLVKMQRTVVQYVTGQLVIGLISAVITVAALVVLCLVFNMPIGIALPLGIACGIFNMIPMFGAVLSSIVVCLVLVFSSPIAALVFFIFYVIYQQIENNIIITKVQSKSSNLPALIVLIAVTLGLYLGGLLGMLIAIPVAGCIKILLEEFVFRRPETADVKVE